MTKRITISDKDYYLILGLKAKYLTDSIEEIIRFEGMKPQNPTTNNDLKPQTTINHETIEVVNLCTCGHPESYHTVDGCLGDGALCGCKQFTSEQSAPP
jgi:hypothetical protein